MMTRLFSTFILCFWFAGTLFAEAIPVAAPVKKELPKPIVTSLPLPAAGLSPRLLRIALLIEVPSVTLQFSDSFEVYGKKEGSEWKKRSSFKEVKVRPTVEGIQWNSETETASEIVFDGNGESIKVGQRAYQGVIRILRKSDSRITVINEIELEEYLRGVLPLEVSASWPIESLKAHAVASRTYALFQSLKEKDNEFALRDNVLSQVYGGSSFYRPQTDHAIRSTRGEILTSDGKIFPAFFHSNCGGRTAAVEEVWFADPNPVFTGVICPFCAGKKNYEWGLEIKLSEIEAKMQAAGYPAKGLNHVEFLDREISGRARQVKLTYARSAPSVVATQFRQILGYDKLKSLKADVTIKNDIAHFHGFGWGHGVGLCQWGSEGQAQMGKDYHQILEYYYSGSEIQKITS